MRGGAWQGPEWHGGVGQGMAGPGWARATDGGTEGSSLPAILMDGLGEASLGRVGYGLARPDLAFLGEAGRGNS